MTFDDIGKSILCAEHTTNSIKQTNGLSLNFKIIPLARKNKTKTINQTMEIKTKYNKIIIVIEQIMSLGGLNHKKALPPSGTYTKVN